MKILVTGAGGFIGSSLCAGLMQEGHEVLGVDSLSPDLYPVAEKLNNINLLKINPRFKFVKKDLAKDDIREELSEAQVVINEAGLPSTQYSWNHLNSCTKNNFLAVGNLLAMVAEFPSLYLVQASSSSVYGDNVDGDENQPLLPVSPYGVTKMAAEKLIEAYGYQAGVRYSILRYFSVYGPNQRPDMAYAIFCESLINGKTIPIFGDGLQTRNNTFILDVVDATMLAATLQPRNMTFNICGSEEISLLHAIDLLEKNLGMEAKTSFLTRNKGDQFRTRGSTEKAFQFLGWTPKVSIKDGLFLQAQAALQSREISQRD